MSDWKKWRSRWVVVAGVAFVLLTLGVAAVAGFVLHDHWELPKVVPPEGAAGQSSPVSESPTTAGEVARELEVIKICLQVIGVGVVGAVLAAAAATLESARRGREDRARLLREQFEASSDLLSRSSQCAQSMYVRCQHYRRLQVSARAPAGSRKARNRARAELDLAYLEFSAAAAAIESEIEARFGPGIGMPRAPKAGWPAVHDATSRRGLVPQGPDQSWWRWHQLRDLLTVYYFSLTEAFPGNVITSNEFDFEGGFHSGLKLQAIVLGRVPVTPPSQEPKPQKETKFDRVAWAVQSEFPPALGAFAAALLVDTTAVAR